MANKKYKKNIFAIFFLFFCTKSISSESNLLKSVEAYSVCATITMKSMEKSQFNLTKKISLSIYFCSWNRDLIKKEFYSLNKNSNENDFNKFIFFVEKNIAIQLVKINENK